MVRRDEPQPCTLDLSMCRVRVLSDMPVSMCVFVCVLRRAVGTVVQHMYRDEYMPPGMVAPYQVKLDGEKKLIYAPVDDDTYIRAID